MKKIISAISVVMLFVASVASCHKEEPVKSPVFTATVNTTATRTTVDASTGKVSWELTDEITITDGSKKSATYKIKSIDSLTGKATFTAKSEQPTLGDGPYTATYGEPPKTAQTYSETPRGLYMTARSYTTSLKFSVGCGLMKLNLQKSGEKVKEIAVTGTNNTTDTLTCPDVDISSQKSFYLALPENFTINRIVITDDKNYVCYLKSDSGVTIKNNTISSVALGADKLHFALLPGEFSIGDGKKVRFSQGNLYWAGSTSTFEFEKDQFSYPTGWNTNHVAHFYWTKTASRAYAVSYDDSDATKDDVLFTNNSDFTVNGEKGWKTLSLDQWKYLLKRENRYKCPVQVGSKAGLVIAPDIFNGEILAVYTDSTWKIAEKDGLVFLPKANSRVENEITDQNMGYYWCHTISPGKETADYLSVSDEFGENDKDDFREDGARGTGRSIRLVRNVN